MLFTGEGAARAINHAGVVVGSRTINDQQVAWSYSGGQLTILSGMTSPISITSAGDVLGVRKEAGVDHLVLLSNGVYRDLGITSEQFLPSTFTMNESLMLVGQSRTGTHFYENGVIRDFAPVPGGGTFTVTGLNDLGQVIGYVRRDAGPYLGAIYEDGVYTYLSEFLPVPSGTSVIATAINNRGQIVANTQERYQKTYLLSPVPEPASWTLLAMAGVAALIGWRLSRRRLSD